MPSPLDKARTRAADEGTLDLAGKLLGHIPATQLTRLDRIAAFAKRTSREDERCAFVRKLIEEFYPKTSTTAAAPAQK